MTSDTANATRWLLDGHWSSETAGEAHAVFNAEGIHCANCASAIHTALDRLPGVRRADVNVVNSRVSVTWDPKEINLGIILSAVGQLGFRPTPLVGEAAVLAQRAERRSALKRIGLAALGSMQVMMYAGGLYAGAYQGIDTSMAEALRIACFVMATPVLWYSGWPILRGGLGDLRRRVLGMDVTVSLALLLAYFASVFNMLRGSGEVYFDSVTMFILFLSIGRFFEMKGRHQAANVTDALARALPSEVRRLTGDDGSSEKIPLADVKPGDRLSIGSQQLIPVDGTVLSGTALVDESLITGESLPQRRGTGQTLLGGSINCGSALTLQVTQEPGDSTLHALVRLLERAQSERPRLGLAAERVASWFVVRVLLATLMVAAIWLVLDPSRAFHAVLAVLVAACPCALSLATPVAIASATSRLARLGVLVMHSDAIEGLAQIDTVMLDKTGTVTAGEPTVIDTTVIRSASPLSPSDARGIGAALESGSSHPLARAFATHTDSRWIASDIQEIPGEGVIGTLDGERWVLGRGALIKTQLSIATEPTTGDHTLVWLASDGGTLVRFMLADGIRPEAIETVQALKKLGLSVQLVSGDRPATVQRVAESLELDIARPEQTPADKLEHLKALQTHHASRVLMVGDGVNDGPVLAAADVSMAMGRGSSLAHAAADLLLLRETLSPLPASIQLARRTLKIIRQNLNWAAAYNFTALPIAALGLMPPWVAAIGMSLSSLLVVFNARRLAVDSIKES
jgi:Cu2+-exporting ATPase